MKAPFELGDTVIVNHDGPDGIAFAVRIERIEGDHIVIETAAGEYRFLNDSKLPIPAVSQPDSLPAAKFDTWLTDNSEINREVYDIDVIERHLNLLRGLRSIVPKQHIETLRALSIG